MMLGKRPRPSIRRTTSMTGIEVDLSNVEDGQPSDAQNSMEWHGAPQGSASQNVLVGPSVQDHRLMATVSPRYHRTGSGDHIETAHFLRTCGLCKRRLAPGRDIYMYRGDTAFCSLECREQQMKHDERKEKCSTVPKDGHPHYHHQSEPLTATSEA